MNGPAATFDLINLASLIFDSLSSLDGPPSVLITKTFLKRKERGLILLGASSSLWA